MAADDVTWRELYQDELMWTVDADDRARVLHDWTSRSAELLAGLTPLRQRDTSPESEWCRDALYEFYALSRTSDWLVELGCPAGTPEPGLGTTGGRTLHQPDLARYEWFLDRIGLERVEHARRFSPFHHEIFAVHPDETIDRVELERVLWPGFRFGELLFSRAGVAVRAPDRLIDPVVATTSTLHFTHRRQPRPAKDLAHGWGSNSQWRTAFPRFYADRDGLHLNWDGDTYLSDDPAPRYGWGGDEPPVSQRRELLLHRCFVTAPAGDEEDHWVFGDRLSLRTDTWPLDPGAILPDPRG